MRRFALVAAVAASLSLVLVGTASADPPNRFTFGAGGGFAHPCGGPAVSYSVLGEGLMVFNEGLFTVRMHATGTASDAVGNTYAVTWNLTSTDDGFGSGTAHLVIVFRGGETTFVFHELFHTGFRPDEPLNIHHEFLTCAGMGRTSP